MGPMVFFEGQDPATALAFFGGEAFSPLAATNFLPRLVGVLVAAAWKILFSSRVSGLVAWWKGLLRGRGPKVQQYCR